MYCPECGTQNIDAKFCQNCGLNLEKTTPAKPSGQNRYEPPASSSSAPPRHSPVIDDLEDAHIADHRDSLSTGYYILSFLFWPVGIFLWAFHRSSKPTSSNNLLVATAAGFIAMFLILLI